MPITISHLAQVVQGATQKEGAGPDGPAPVRAPCGTLPDSGYLSSQVSGKESPQR